MIYCFIHAQVQVKHLGKKTNIVFRNIFEIRKYWDSCKPFWDFVGALVTPPTVGLITTKIVLFRLEVWYLAFWQILGN